MDNRSRQIFQRQNAPDNLNVLKAARCCYARGKFFGIFNVLLMVFIPICLNIFIRFNQNNVLEAVIVVITIIVSILGYLCEREIQLDKLNGASLQQQFDSTIFDIKLESDISI